MWATRRLIDVPENVPSHKQYRDECVRTIARSCRVIAEEGATSGTVVVDDVVVDDDVVVVVVVDAVVDDVT